MEAVSLMSVRVHSRPQEAEPLWLQADLVQEGATQTSLSMRRGKCVSFSSFKEYLSALAAFQFLGRHFAVYPP